MCVFWVWSCWYSPARREAQARTVLVCRLAAEAAAVVLVSCVCVCVYASV